MELSGGDDFRGDRRQTKLSGPSCEAFGGGHQRLQATDCTLLEEGTYVGSGGGVLTASFLFQ
jgi:hypothetical protein